MGQGSWGSRGWFRGRGYRATGGWDRVPGGAEAGLEGRGTEPKVGGTGFLVEQRLVERKGYRASGGRDRVPGGADAGLEEGVQSLWWVGQGPGGAEAGLEEGVQSLRWVGHSSWGSRGWDRGGIGEQSLRWVGQGSWGSRGRFRGKGTEPQMGGTEFLGEQRLV